MYSVHVKNKSRPFSTSIFRFGLLLKSKGLVPEKIIEENQLFACLFTFYNLSTHSHSTHTLFK